MNIIDYKPILSVVASAEEWEAFDHNLPCEVGERIRQEVWRTPKSERHSILIKFDYRVADILREMGATKRVEVKNETRAKAVTELSGLPPWSWPKVSHAQVSGVAETEATT